MENKADLDRSHSPMMAMALVAFEWNGEPVVPGRHGTVPFQAG